MYTCSEFTLMDAPDRVRLTLSQRGEKEEKIYNMGYSGKFIIAELLRRLGRGSEEGGLRRKAKPGIEPHFLAVGLPSERVDEPGRRVSKNCAGGICMWVGANYCSHHERFGMCLFNIRLQKYIMR